MRWDRIRTAFVPRRSVLRRRSDRAETAARWAAVVLLVLAVPFLLAVGAARAQDVRDAAAHARATARPVVGTVTEVRPRPARSPDGTPSGGLDVTVSWTGPDGTVRTTRDTAFAGTVPGRRWPMWVDATGARVRTPASGADAVVQGVLLAGLLGSGAATVLAGLLAALRWSLDRARLRQWEADWAAFDRRRRRGLTG